LDSIRALSKESEIDMVLHREKRKAVALVMIVQVFLLLVSGMALVHADGEESLYGTVERIAPRSITIRLTEKRKYASARSAGAEVILAITDETMIRDEFVHIVSVGNLSVGTSVYVKPRTLPNGERLAVLIQILRRAR
jgi:hypothetical protein